MKLYVHNFHLFLSSKCGIMRNISDCGAHFPCYLMQVIIFAKNFFSSLFRVAFSVWKASSSCLLKSSVFHAAFVLSYSTFICTCSHFENLSMQQNMMLQYQQLVLDLIILWWRQLLQLKLVLSCSEGRILGLQPS